MSAYSQLELFFQQLSDLEHLSALGNWDEAVMMPSGGANARANAMSTLDRLMHEKLTDKKIGELIKTALDESKLTPWQQANLGWMQRLYTHAVCLPADLVEKLSQARSASEHIWRTLRAQNDWQTFLPYLEKTLKYTRESAKLRGQFFNLSPYDVLIDEFSPGITAKFINPIFDKLKKVLPTYIEKIIAKQPALIPLTGPFAIAQQRELGLALMQAIGFDFNHGRLDVSHHPFCGGVPQDVRLTTRYNEHEFITSAMGTCHETGHARYEQNLPQQWQRQPVGRIHSMTMHESQSLLIEMQACRSPQFMQFLSLLIKQHFGNEESFDAQNLYHHYTHVKKQLIRVDADEVSYPLHVIARYEIEKALIDGEIECQDIPALWNEKMLQYLDLNTSGNFKDGPMQDVHWAAGLFGYFPAYTLGSLTAAQLFAKAKQAQPKLMTDLAHGNFTSLYDWLIPHFQAHASSLSFDELMHSATGSTLKSDYFLAHVEARYLST